MVDSDLEDLRQGAPRRARSEEPTRSEASHGRSERSALARGSAPHSVDLAALASLLVAAIGRAGGGQPSNIVVTNCGCRSDDQPADPRPNHLNAKRKD